MRNRINIQSGVGNIAIAKIPGEMCSARGIIDKINRMG